MTAGKNLLLTTHHVMQMMMDPAGKLLMPSFIVGIRLEAMTEKMNGTARAGEQILQVKDHNVSMLTSNV